MDLGVILNMKTLLKSWLPLAMVTMVLLSGCSNSEPPQIQGTVLPGGKQLTPFALKVSNGDSFSEQSLRGHWSLVFFGFTSCPAICPNTLNMMNQVWQQLEQQQQLGDTEFVFVSVDPKRDGLARLDDYVHRYNQRFVGVTGAHSQLRSFASQLGVPYTVEESADDNYFVDHGTMIAVVNPAGRYQAVLTGPHNKDQLVKDLAALRSYFS